MNRFLLNSNVIKTIVGFISIILGTVLFKIGLYYEGLKIYCWVYRVIGLQIYRKIVFTRIKNVARVCATSTENPILKKFKKSRGYLRIKNRFLRSEMNDKQIKPFCIVLKKYQNGEKGVLLLKFAEFFDFFVASFNYKEIIEKYNIVLEMSWAGACNLTFFSFISPKSTLYIQAIEEDDRKFLIELDANICPIPLGSGDWVNADECECDGLLEKDIDVLMVGHWGRIKNHEILFSALNRVNRNLNVVLIGQPHNNRTVINIKSELEKKLKNEKITTQIIEDIPFSKVIEFYHRSKCSVLLSFKEGHNKAVMESMFCNTPVILMENHSGGAQIYINEQTGVFANKIDLHEKIMFVIDNYKKFKPKDFIKMHSGCCISTYTLNSYLKKYSTTKTNDWTSDIVPKFNGPFLKYYVVGDEKKFSDDYSFVLSQYICT